MSKYQITARKWRPQVLSELVGQEHIAKALHNAILSGRIGHAYLFSGPRGTGKTSTARILAKSLSCKEGITTTPCLRCANCIEIANGTSYDILEIDGASNRGIDQIRELKDNIAYMPSKSKYKIVIIDEVHMVTDQAFNSLLKTLEEPPPYMIFIFATTEVHKVKLTIRSRCEHYGFRLLSIDDIKGQLKKIALKEKIEIDDSCLFKIAKVSEGSMRDSLNLFDQVISYANGKVVDSRLIEELFGIFPSELYYNFLDSLISKDLLSLLSIASTLISKGDSISNFTQGLTKQFRDIIVLKKEIEEKKEGFVLSLSKDEISKINKYAKAFKASEIIEIINLLISLNQELKKTLSEEYTFQSYIFRLINYENFIELGTILKRIKLIEKRLLEEVGGVVSVEERTVSSIARKAIKKDLEKKKKKKKKDKLGENEATIENEAVIRESKQEEVRKEVGGAEAVEVRANKSFALLEQIKKAIQSDNIMLATYLGYVNDFKITGSELVLYFSDEIYFDKVSLKKNINIIEEVCYNKIMGKTIRLKTKLIEEKETNQGVPSKEDKVSDIVTKFKGKIIT